MNEFLNESKEVANLFIKNVLFIDDQIKWDQEDNDIHDLNAKALIHEFAKEGKSCTFYNVEESLDFNAEEEIILKITPNSDVIVLDWKMKHELVGQEQVEDPEEDVEEEESRGKFTLQLLCSLADKYKDSLKLILILTGETGGNGILDAIHKNQQFEKFKKNEGDFSLEYEKIKISIYFKPELHGKHGTELISGKIIPNYQSLTDIIDKEFASLTGGLISNTALKTISVIRDNASKLLKIYQKELDPAYLAHRILLTFPENAEDLLRETILSSITTLVNTNQISDKCDLGSIKKWLAQYQFYKTNQILIDDSTIAISNEVLGEMSGIGLIKTVHGRRAAAGISKSKVEKEYEHKLKNNQIDYLSYFTPISTTNPNLNEDFAILNHHKKYFESPNFVPFLTLGTVIKSNEEKYFICVQPLCDTVRIKLNNNNFLFLPLKKNTKPGDTKIIVKNNDETYLKLSPIYKANSLKIITFKLTDGIDFIKASENKFTAIDGGIEQEYTWVLDLKDNHAQRIANEFGAYISRVGLDESEWLRRS